MKLHNRKSLFTSILAMFAFLPLLAWSGVDETISELQHEWAIANYQLTGDEKEEAWEQLLVKAGQATETWPGRAEPLIWSGIIKSTCAGSAGGLQALSLVKASKKDLEKAMAIDAGALNGSAYTSLGSLYYMVPGWPIAFGDDDKAEELLEQAVSIAPDDIDSNYFYAGFLKEQGKYELAIQYYRKAAGAPARAGRPLADSGRQMEISSALATLEQNLASR